MLSNPASTACVIVIMNNEPRVVRVVSREIYNLLTDAMHRPVNDRIAHAVLVPMRQPI